MSSDEGSASMSIPLPEVEVHSVSGQLRTLLEVAEAIVTHRDLPALMHDLAGRLHRVVRFDYLGLILSDCATGTLCLHVLDSSEPVPMPPETAIPPQAYPDWWVWQNQQSWICSDLDKETR